MEMVSIIQLDFSGDRCLRGNKSRNKMSNCNQQEDRKDRCCRCRLTLFKHADDRFALLDDRADGTVMAVAFVIRFRGNIEAREQQDKQQQAS